MRPQDEANGPVVSVVITAYDSAQTIHEAIHSCLQQFGVEFEVVTVLDGHDPTTRRLVESFSDPRVRIIELDRVGRVKALNEGWKAARGQLIAIHDADDVMLPGRLLAQATFMDAHPDCQVLGGQLIHFGPWGQASWRAPWPERPKDIDAWIRNGKMPIAHPTMMIRRSVLLRSGGYAEDFARVHDFELLLRTYRPGTYRNLPIALAKYRSPTPFPTLSYWLREERGRRAAIRAHPSIAYTANPSPRYRLLNDAVDCARWIPRAFLDRARRRLEASRQGLDNSRIDGVPIQATTLESAILFAIENLGNRQPQTYRFLNAYTFWLTKTMPNYRTLLQTRGINYPDGLPLSVLLRTVVPSHADQIRGPLFMRQLFDQGRSVNLRHFLYGGTPDGVIALRDSLQQRYPGALVVGTISPPFRPLLPSERKSFADEMKNAEPHIIWVGTGAPKQDFEAALITDDTGVATGAVGAAFDFLAGTKREAPSLVSKAGLEWLFRLLTEPRRLWRRYLVGNTYFIYVSVRTLARFARRSARTSNGARTAIEP